MAPDKLCSELPGQDLSSVFSLWRRTLFLHRTQQEDKDLNTAEENPCAEGCRSPRQTSLPTPTKAPCGLTFPGGVSDTEEIQ